MKRDLHIKTEHEAKERHVLESWFNICKETYTRKETDSSWSSTSENNPTNIHKTDGLTNAKFEKSLSHGFGDS